MNPLMYLVSQLYINTDNKTNEIAGIQGQFNALTPKLRSFLIEIFISSIFTLC